MWKKIRRGMLITLLVLWAVGASVSAYLSNLRMVEAEVHADICAQHISTLFTLPPEEGKLASAAGSNWP